MICTPMYAQKANQRSGGAGYEATIITPELAGKVSQRKFLHLLREGDWEDDAIRKLVRGRIGFDLRGDPYDDAQYERLVRHLHDAADPPPPVGPRPDFTAKQSERPEERISGDAKRAVHFSPVNQKLSPKEIKLLWAAAQDPDGQILYSKSLEGEGLRANSSCLSLTGPRMRLNSLIQARDIASLFGFPKCKSSRGTSSCCWTKRQVSEAAKTKPSIAFEKEQNLTRHHA